MVAQIRDLIALGIGALFPVLLVVIDPITEDAVMSGCNDNLFVGNDSLKRGSNSSGLVSQGQSSSASCLGLESQNSNISGYILSIISTDITSSKLTAVIGFSQSRPSSQINPSSAARSLFNTQIFITVTAHNSGQFQYILIEVQSKAKTGNGHSLIADGNGNSVTNLNFICTYIHFHSVLHSSCGKNQHCSYQRNTQDNGEKFLVCFHMFSPL